MNITIVTPWYQHHELLPDYEDAVAPELQEGDEVMVIDNGGAPRMPFRTWSRGDNLGFCKASNVGLLYARTEAVLFLNNDIALVRRGWLAEIREAVEPGVLAGTLRSGPHSAVDGQVMPYLDGWCLAGMAADLRALGGFDQSLIEPAYYSDNLLCLEARAAGMTLRDVRLGLYHKENVTAGHGSDVQAASAANRDRYLARARELLVAV